MNDSNFHKEELSIQFQVLGETHCLEALGQIEADLQATSERKDYRPIQLSSLYICLLMLYP
jgi:hypothetical protein